MRLLGNALRFFVRLYGRFAGSLGRGRHGWTFRAIEKKKWMISAGGGELHTEIYTPKNTKEAHADFSGTHTLRDSPAGQRIQARNFTAIRTCSPTDNVSYFRTFAGGWLRGQFVMNRPVHDAGTQGRDEARTLTNHRMVGENVPNNNAAWARREFPTEAFWRRWRW